jgi:arginase family protein
MTRASDFVREHASGLAKFASTRCAIAGGVVEDVRLLGHQRQKAQACDNADCRLRRRRRRLLRHRAQYAPHHAECSGNSGPQGASRDARRRPFGNVSAGARIRRFKPLDIVHFDAHLDWIDHVEGIKFANGSPFRRISELPFVRHMTHLGIRDLRSREGDYNDAIKFGAQIFTRQQIRERGPRAIVEAMPQMNNIYVSIDIDGLDPSFAPGTGSPTVETSRRALLPWPRVDQSVRAPRNFHPRLCADPLVSTSVCRRHQRTASWQND